MRLAQFLARAVYTAAPLALTLITSQPVAAQECGTTPDPAAAQLRQLAGSCGTAAFAIGTLERRTDKLVVTIARGNVYVRAVHLRYEGGAEAQVPLHRMLSSGDATPEFPTTRDGRALQLVRADVAAPGAGNDPLLLALAPAGNAVVTTGAVGDGTPKTALDKRAWVLAASATASLAQRRDTFEIGRQKGRFDHLVLSARGRDLPVQSVQIMPVSGPPWTVDLRAVITSGTLAAPIRIDPPDFIRSVTVTYGTPSPEAALHPPVVEVHGRQTDGWEGRVGENRQYAGGWLLLGTVDVVSTPHQARAPLRIAGREGPFKKVRFIARRGAVDLVAATVQAGDGRSETLAVNALLMPGVPSAPVEFANGAALPIASLSISPRLKPLAHVDATVEVWAQY